MTYKTSKVIIIETDLGTVNVDPERVGVAAVVEQEQGGEKAGTELHSFWSCDARQSGVTDDAADLKLRDLIVVNLTC